MKKLIPTSLLAGVTLALVTSCGASLDAVRVREKFDGGSFSRVKELQLEPSVEIDLPDRPLRVAVAPPLELSSVRGPWNSFRFYEHQRYTSWDREDIEVIERLEGNLIENGLVAELHALPQLALEIEGNVRTMGAESQGTFPWLQAGLSAASNAGFDAIVFLRNADDVGGRTSPWAVLDITLVGALLFQVHEIQALSLMEGVVLHAPSGGVLLTTTGQGEQAEWSTFLDAPDTTDRMRAAARHAALEDLSVNVVEALADLH